MLCLLSLLQQQFSSLTITTLSDKLLSGAVAVKDIFFTDDFILVSVIQRGTH